MVCSLFWLIRLIFSLFAVKLFDILCESMLCYVMFIYMWLACSLLSFGNHYHERKWPRRLSLSDKGKIYTGKLLFTYVQKRRKPRHLIQPSPLTPSCDLPHCQSACTTRVALPLPVFKAPMKDPHHSPLSSRLNESPEIGVISSLDVFPQTPRIATSRTAVSFWNVLRLDTH